MIVKSFTADTVAGALKLVRSELGGDAVILKTRRLDPASRTGTPRVEVTACVDRQATATIQPVTITAPAPVVETTAAHFPAKAITAKLDFLIDILQVPARKDLYPGNIGRMFASLLQADLPERMAVALADEIAGRFEPNESFEKITAAATDALYRRVQDSSLAEPITVGQKILFVGPPGSGKTSLLARLAAHLLTEKKLPVCLTSMIQPKVSAPEELQSYADLLDVERLDLARQTDRSQSGIDKVMLIDSPALPTTDKKSLAAFGEHISRIQPNRVIGVFSALTRSSDLLDYFRACVDLGITDLAFTMTDLTMRLGGIVGLALQAKRPIVMLGSGTKPNALTLRPDLRRMVASLFESREGKDHD